MDLEQQTREVVIKLGSQGYEVEFKGAMWGRRFIDQSHQAMLRSFPKYLAEIRAKGEMKNDRRSEDSGTGTGTEQGEGEERSTGEGGGLEINTTSDESGVDSGAVHGDSGPDGGAGPDDREVVKLLKEGKVRERPRHRRAG